MFAHIDGVSANTASAIPVKSIHRALNGKTDAEMDAIFICGYDLLLSKVHSESPRAVQVTYLTLYKRLKMYDKKPENATSKLCKMFK